MIQPKSDSLSLVDNQRIAQIETIVSPEEVVEAYPIDQQLADMITLHRQTISNIIHLKDDRLLVITWPCSIHNPLEALEYAKRLADVKEKNPHLYLVMRTYFEKPRTTIWWKWLINDPYLDESYDINAWLQIARKLLLEINKMWIPTAVEFLDTLTPQYIADIVSYGAIGARTTESQEHRKLVSGLSMPVGFKNGTLGNLDIATNAIRSANAPHTFLSVTKEWHIAKVTTTGNSDGHIILRGGKSWPNYDSVHIAHTKEVLESEKISSGIVIDVSHGNSEKNYQNQPKVVHNIANQVASGNRNIVWVMIEGNLESGNQSLDAVLKKSKDDILQRLLPWVSITDGCVDWETNRKMLRVLDDAVVVRKERM